MAEPAEQKKARREQARQAKRRQQQDEICSRLSAGEPLVRICEAPGMPKRRTVFQWLRDDPEFARVYTIARAELAHLHFDRAIEVASRTPATFTDDRGVTRVDPAAVQAQRLESDTLKWAAARLLPKVYGERLDVTTDGESINAPAAATDPVEVAKRVAFLLAMGNNVLEEQPPQPAAPLLLPAPKSVAPVYDAYRKNRPVQ